MLILTALKSNGKLMVLSSSEKRQVLRKLREKTRFYCPQCKEPVILKVGDIVIPHFSHRQEASCTALFSEGESQEHLEGKEQLYHFFKRLQKDVQLEPYVDVLAQRPDLLVTIESLQIPVEFQCSAIPITQIEARTNGYKSVGMQPIWLLRTPVKHQTFPLDVCVFNLTRFEESFITHKSSVGSLILTYNPQSEQFHYFSSLLHIGGKRYIGLHRKLPTPKQIFPFAMPKQPTEKELMRYLFIYLTMREKYLSTTVFKNRRGINNPFLRQCYELRIIPANLPNWIGIPTQAMQTFREHPCEWQLALIHFLKKHAIQLSELSLSEIRSFVKPFIGSTLQQITACVHYRDFLLSKGLDILNTQKELTNQEMYQQLVATLLANYDKN